jgi:predicted nicotinamide N-methyase
MDDPNPQTSADGIFTFQCLENCSVGPGGRVWDGSACLARFIATSSIWCPRVRSGQIRIIELGAGVGLPSLTCAKLGATSVCVTDREQYVDLLRQNVNHNLTVSEAAKVRVQALEWGQVKSFWKGGGSRRYDLVLASELLGVGDEGLFDLLIKTLEDLCDDDTVILLSHRFRAEFEHRFFEKAREALFESKPVGELSLDMTEQGDPRADHFCTNSNVVIYELRKIRNHE